MESKPQLSEINKQKSDTQNDAKTGRKSRRGSGQTVVPDQVTRGPGQIQTQGQGSKGKYGEGQGERVWVRESQIGLPERSREGPGQSEPVQSQLEPGQSRRLGQGARQGERFPRQRLQQILEEDDQPKLAGSSTFSENNEQPFYKKHDYECTNSETNKKNEFYDMKFYMNNCRGLQSKIGSVRNILIDNDIDVAVISETQNSKDKNIPISGYVCYWRNRILREKGGVCVYIKEKFGSDVMKHETGLENNEFFVIRLECTDPNIILICYYGVIEGQYNADQVTAMQSDIFNLMKKYDEEGNRVYWCGDFNNHIPNECGITGNPDKTSKGGVNLVKFVKEENFVILNRRDTFHTHIDRSDGVSRILDLVVTNDDSNVKAFEVDKTGDFTPYRIMRGKDGHKKRLSDHLGVKWNVQVVLAKTKSHKIVMWNYNKINGNHKYEAFTNESAYDLEQYIEEEDDIEAIHEHILQVIEEAKKHSYGKITKTKSQLKRMTDGQIWRQRVRDVEQSVLGLKKKRLNDKIWEMRSKTSDKYNDKQFVGVKRPDNGRMTMNREETFDVMLEYNYDLLKKENGNDNDLDKEDLEVNNEKPEEKLMREMKEFAVKYALEQDGFEEDEELFESDFWLVVEKIKANNKNVYRDFIMAGEKFKLAIFKFYQKCYKMEVMPESYEFTELMQLYKGKGNRLELKSSRFLHLKPWLPKGYEKMLMTKMEQKMFKHTPDYQVGGQKLGSTNEHLLSMITTMRRLEKLQGGGSILFMDIKACFDRVRLNDILFEATQCGVKGKPLRCISEYTGNLKIKMRGDPKSDRCRELSNSTGQGSGFAPVGTSMVMAKTLDNRIEERTEEEKEEIIKEVGGVKLYPNFFVDDLAKNCSAGGEVSLMGEVITKMLDELKLQAHSEKSGVLVYGENQDDFKSELENLKPEVQRFVLAFKTQETYLGMVFTNGGASDSIQQTLEARRQKCLAKAADIKRKLEDERMEGVGWLAGVVLVYNAVIVSTLTYGAAAMTGLTDKQWDYLESIQRQCLLHILGISLKTTHQSLLYVLGISPIKDVVKKLQISFVNNLYHIKQTGQCLETIKNDFKNGDIKGIVGEVKEYCEEYGLSDVTEYYIHPVVIKKRIERVVLDRQWIADLKGKKPPLSIRRDNRAPKFYFNLPKNKAKLMLCYEVGDLNLRKVRKHEALKRYGSTKCLFPHCNEEDTLEHLKTCDGYSTKYDENAGPYEFIDFLTSIELERNSLFRRSLVNFKTL